jgi:Na+/H+-translocating membrane pyrophosphatase
MMLPVVGFPIVVVLAGFIGTTINVAEMLGGYMAGLLSGVLWAFSNNAGGAWDNAKKSLKLGL